MLNAAARVVTGTWKFDRSLGQILHDELHWLDVPDRVFFKQAVTVNRCLNGRAPPYLSDYCVPAASVKTLSSLCVLACSTSLPAQHLRPSGLFSCWPHSLELSPGFHPGPDHQWSLSDVCLKRTCSLDTSAFSALEVLDDNRAYKFTYLLTTNSVKALKGTRRTDAGHGKSSFLEPIRTN